MNSTERTHLTKIRHLGATTLHRMATLLKTAPVVQPIPPTVATINDLAAGSPLAVVPADLDARLSAIGERGRSAAGTTK